MIEWIIGFLVAKWWTDKDEKKNRPQEDYSGVIDAGGIPYGYVRDGETIKDLQ